MSFNKKSLRIRGTSCDIILNPELNTRKHFQTFIEEFHDSF